MLSICKGLCFPNANDFIAGGASDLPDLRGLVDEANLNSHKRMVLGQAMIKLMISRIVPLEMSDNILLKMRLHTR